MERIENFITINKKHVLLIFLHRFIGNKHIFHSVSVTFTVPLRDNLPLVI